MLQVNTCKRLVVRLDGEGLAKQVVVESLTAVHDGEKFAFSLGILSFCDSVKRLLINFETVISWAAAWKTVADQKWQRGLFSVLVLVVVCHTRHITILRSNWFKHGCHGQGYGVVRLAHKLCLWVSFKYAKVSLFFFNCLMKNIHFAAVRNNVAEPVGTMALELVIIDCYMSQRRIENTFLTPPSNFEIKRFKFCMKIDRRPCNTM